MRALCGGQREKGWEEVKSSNKIDASRREEETETKNKTGGEEERRKLRQRECVLSGFIEVGRKDLSHFLLLYSSSSSASSSSSSSCQTFRLSPSLCLLDFPFLSCTTSSNTLFTNKFHP